MRGERSRTLISRYRCSYNCPRLFRNHSSRSPWIRMSARLTLPHRLNQACGLCDRSQNHALSRALSIDLGTHETALYYGNLPCSDCHPMPYREFQDSAGLTWTVWDTYPTKPEVIDPRWRGGWLAFQSGTVRRRLAPIPKGWIDASPSRLELMCKAAESTPRETPARGTESSPSD